MRERGREMKVNSISSFTYNSNNVNFKRTAVPYPEYEYGYNKNDSSFEGQVTSAINKISALFSPSLSHESSKIKTGIDNLYTNKESLENTTPKKQLLSVFG